jgi:hypothetical protein
VPSRCLQNERPGSAPSRPQLRPKSKASGAPKKAAIVKALRDETGCASHCSFQSFGIGKVRLTVINDVALHIPAQCAIERKSIESAEIVAVKRENFLRGTAHGKYV